MGYMHIDNLYKNQDVLMFREAYALEKIHGTSAHVAYGPGGLTFFSAFLFDELLALPWPQTEFGDVYLILKEAWINQWNVWFLE